MTVLMFATKDQYRFARTFFTNGDVLQPTWDPPTLTATFNDPIVSRLFNRIISEKAIILPLFGAKLDHWLITARSATEIDQIVGHVKGFLFPTYVRFADPRWQAFASKPTELCRLGSTLYGTGYYRLESTSTQRKHILAQLDKWMTLEDAKPPLAELVRPTYRGVITDFEYALTAEDWEGAAELVRTAHKAHLTTQENITFLEYRLLADQHLWAAVIEDEHYEYLAQISVPRKVKEIMLQAFHDQRVANREMVSWEEGYKAFVNNFSTAGNLLTARSELTSDSVLKLFAYQAVLKRDGESIREIIDEASGVLTEQLEQIGRLLVDPIPPEPEPIEVSIEDQAAHFLREKRYDRAWKLALQIETRKQRTIILLQIAASCHDSEREIIAYGEYRKCSEKHQLEIVSDVPHLKYFLVSQERTFLKREMDASQTLNVETWVEWFSAAKGNPTHPALYDSMEQLFSIDRAEQYKSTQLELFYTMLVEFSESTFRSKSYIETFVKKLATRLIDDEQFPRDNGAYVDLYEGLFESVLVLDRNERNLKILLRLLEGILQATPKARDIYFEELKNYTSHYNQAIFPLLQELFEVFTAHGIKSEKVNQWMNAVLEELLQQRIRLSQYDLLVWEELAVWAHCRADLLKKLQAYWERNGDSDGASSIPRLANGFKILIFMLNESTATRIKNHILRLNSDVDVDIYSHKSPNADVLRSAPNADMIVLVTACIKHAISYAIEPITDREKRVYPGKSQGSSAILQAIEEHIKHLPN